MADARPSAAIRSSLSDARAEVKRILAEKQLGRVKPKFVAFDDAKAEYLAECDKKNRPSTVKSYRRHLTVHYQFGRKHIADITTREITARQFNL